MPPSWQGAAYNAAVKYSDGDSGIAEAKYAVANNTAVIPGSLSDLPASGSSVTISAQGTNYIYYKVTDNAGNITSGWSGAIRIDNVVPELTVSANKGTSGGEAYTSGAWTDNNVVFTFGNNATQLSGTTYKVSIGGGSFENIAGNTYTVSANTDTAYKLKAVSGSGKESNVIEYAVKRDSILPAVTGISPSNGAEDQSITPAVSFNANEQLVKGGGYLTIYNKRTNAKVMDIHSNNNRVKLSDGNRTVRITLPEMLEKDTEYYITVSEGFVTDRAGNKLPAFGTKDTWKFSTVSSPVIPDNEIIVLGYVVDLISRTAPGGEETVQTLTAVNDKQAERQHNIIAKAGYTENGTDYYVRLKVTPTMSASPEVINVSASEGTAALSTDKKSIDVLIPQSANEAVVTISLGSGSGNQFSIKIINSSYRALVETSGGISATADESNLLNSVDLSREVEAEQQPNTTVDVTLKMVVEQKAAAEIPDVQGIEQAVPGASMLFLDIVIEKVVVTTVEGGASTTEREAVTVTQQPVVIVIDLPGELRGKHSYQIVREHNVVIDVLPAAVINNGTKLRFETDRFSTYTIACKDIPGGSGSSSSSNSSSSSGSTVNTATRKIDSITADSEKMSVDISNINSDTIAADDMNTLVPYTKEKETEIITGFSTVSGKHLKWIAKKGLTYWFKNNYKDFKDINTHWAGKDILFNSARELLDGTAPGMFSTDKGMTRGMFVTVLGRLWNVDVSSITASSFTDVKEDSWYGPYVEWALEAGIIDGYGDRLFGPDDVITREQMTVIMTRFVEYTGLEMDKKNETFTFADNDEISTWAVNAVKTMQQAGIVNGKPKMLFDPKGRATRAEVAAAIKRFIENVVE